MGWPGPRQQPRGALKPSFCLLFVKRLSFRVGTRKRPSQEIVLLREAGSGTRSVSEHPESRGEERERERCRRPQYLSARPVSRLQALTLAVPVSVRQSLS